MTSLADLLSSLVDAVPLEAGDGDAGVRLEVDEVELALPIEARLGRDGRFLAGAPRGRLATGFDSPLGELAFVLVRGDA